MIPPSPPPPAPPASDQPPQKRGPGRPPGRLNNATLFKRAAMEAAMNAITPKGGEDVMALQYLQAIYRDERLPVELRMKAAALAGPLETPRPTPAPQKDDGPLHERLRDALIRTGKASAVAPSPGLSPSEAAELAAMIGFEP